MAVMSRRIVPLAFAAAYGWVLVQPPMLPGGVIGGGTPIDEWTVLGRFDSREACEKQRTESNAKLFATMPEYEPDPAQRAQPTEFAAASRCVERDDSAATSTPSDDSSNDD